MTRAIGRNRRVDTDFEVYPGLYRVIAGSKARRKTSRQFPPDFFDAMEGYRLEQGQFDCEGEEVEDTPTSCYWSKVDSISSR